MATISKQELRTLFDQLTNEYEYLSSNRNKLEADCKKLQEYIEAQIVQIKQINGDFEKLRHEYIQHGADPAKTFNEISSSYRSSTNDQGTSYIPQNQSYQQQNMGASSSQMSNQSQGIVGSQNQGQYANDQYIQQQQPIQEQEEQLDQDLELTTLVSAEQIRNPLLINLFVEIEDTSVICSTSFSPDGICLAIGSDKMLRVYNLEKDDFLIEKTIGDESDANDESSHNHVRSIVWTSDGKTIICGSEDNKIRSFDLNSSGEGDFGKMTHCFVAGNGDVFQLQISKSGAFLASVTSDGCLTIYSLNSNMENESDSNYAKYQVLAVLSRGNDPSKAVAATSLSISDDDKYIAVGYSDNFVAIWEIENQSIIVEQECHTKDVYAVKFVPNGRLVTASLDASIKIWNVNIEEKVITKEIELETPPQTEPAANPNEANKDEEKNTDQKEEDQQQQQQSQQEQKKENENEGGEEKHDENDGAENEQKQKEDTNESKDEQKEETNENKPSETEKVENTENNENEEQQNANNIQKVSKVVEIGSLNLWREIAGHTDFVLSLAIDPSGTWLLSGSKDLTVRLTNLEDGLMIYSIKAHKNSIITVCFNPNGKMFCTGSGDKTVKIWSISPEEDVDA